MGRLLLKLLLNGCLFINAIAFLFSDYKLDLPLEFRLPDYVIPEHYNIKLDLAYIDVEGKSFNFSGTCEANIKIISPTWYISLHAQKPQIEVPLQNVTLTNIKSLDLYTPSNVVYKKETHVLIFFFDYTLSRGHYLLNMSFIGFADDGGSIFFRNTYTTYFGTKAWFIGTQFHPIGARQLFPCWDEPALKATFNICVRHNLKYVPLSNMPIEDVFVADINLLWTCFNTTPLIPTYQVIFVLNNIFPRNKYELLYEGKMFANKTLDIIIEHIHEWEYSENISDVKHIITSDSRNNGMGLILYREVTYLYNKTLDPITRKMEVARTIAYELTHQWFDNLVSPSWWSDYWLNEGIAMLLGMDIINKIFQDFRIFDLFVIQVQQESLRLDSYIGGVMKPLISKVNQPSEIESVFSFSHYIKAPVILRMLQHFLTDEVFRKGIEIFLSKHKFNSASLDDFWNAIETAHNATKIPNNKKFDIKKIMNTWTKKKHYPVLKITQLNIKYLRISVDKNIVEHNWFIPVTITKQTEPDTYYTIDMSWQVYNNWKVQSDFTVSRDFVLPSKEDEWIIVNLQQTGYYRVNYEVENWRKIAKYLNSANYTKIHVLNRAQIIDDAYYFLSIGQLDLYTFLELTKYLSQETDYVAWYPMIKALEKMSSAFPMLDERIDLVKKSMGEILNGVLEQIGYEERSEENMLTTCLRQEVAKWACILEHPKCIHMAKYKLERHIIHSEKLLPWWKEWTYCKGIMTEQNLNGIWSLILKKWASDSYNRILEFLTCVARPNSIKEYLNKKTIEVYLDGKKTYSKKFQDIDYVNKFLFLITKHARNDEILEYILQNFEKLKPRKVNTVAALIIIINNVYFERQLKKITEFVENNLTKQENSFIFNNNLIKNIMFHNERDKIYEYVRNLVHQRISLIHLKIEKRSYEITLFKI